MSRNQKLTPILTGRTVAAIEPPATTPAAPVSAFAPSAAATWHVRFDDGSTLTVRTDGTAPQGADQAGTGRVADVTQHGTTLTIAFGSGEKASSEGAVPALVFQTAEAAACVMVRDAAGKMEYAD